MSVKVAANNMNPLSKAMQHNTNWGNMSAIVVANNMKDKKTMDTDCRPCTDNMNVDEDNRWEFDCNKRNDFEPAVLDLAL